MGTASEVYIASLYPLIYFVIALLLTVFSSFGMRSQLVPVAGNNRYMWAWLFGVFFIFFFGLRPPMTYLMGDTITYAQGYYSLQENGSMPGTDREILFQFIENFFAKNGFSIAWWFTAVATIYILPNLVGIKRLFPGQEGVPFVFYIVFFLFLSGGLNGIRNADAYSIAFFAITLITTTSNLNKLLIACLFLVAYQFHHSVIIMIVSFLAAIFLIKGTRGAILVWLSAIVLSLIFGNSLGLVASDLFGDERLSSYVVNGTNMQQMSKDFSHVGFRWDFLIFSALPILIGYIFTVKLNVQDRIFQILLNTYIIANAIWIIFMYASYSNRFAMLSWCIYPYVLCYPFLKFDVISDDARTKWLVILLWAMFVFTNM